MRTERSTSFAAHSAFTPRVMAFDYVAFPVDNVVQIWGNNPQAYTANCVLPGFAPVTVSIPANTYSSFLSQADANSKALAAATAQAIALLICCYSQDPLPDTPAFGGLTGLYSNTGTTQYGLLPFEQVAESVAPYTSQLHNWTMCPTCDFCSGPDNEGVTQPRPYTQRWFVKNVDGAFVYGKDGITQNPVPPELFTGIRAVDITYMSIGFDANAKPCFAFQTTPGTVLLRRNVAGTPTFNTFAGDTPKLWFDGILQPDGTQTDLVCFYVRNGQIKSRFQRDLFGTEYTQLAPSPPAVRITKTDAWTSKQNLYFIDSLNVFWLVQSHVYPPFPTIVTDQGSLTVLPGVLTYALIDIPTGPYTDTGSLDIAPASLTYTAVIVPTAALTEQGSLDLAPAALTYTQVIVSGGSTSEAGSLTVLPKTLTYTLSVVSGGTYGEANNFSVVPGAISYS